MFGQHLIIVTLNVVVVIVGLILKVQWHLLRIIIANEDRLDKVHVQRHVFFTYLLLLVLHRLLKHLAELVS